MNDPLSQRQSVATPPRKKHSAFFRTTRILAIVIFLGGLFMAGIFGYKILAAGNSISTVKQSLLGQLSDLLFKSGNKLGGETEDQINILLMAVGGEGHSGENLADTIMVASIQPSTNKVALLSIPRDLYVQVPGEQFYSKLNAIHAYGEARKKNNGPELMEEKVKEITGLELHYFARVDFTAFKKIVDAIGGVNVHIENGFTDYLHEIAFPTGTETMNGDRALAYVRARYVEGPEGGDFKRAARQQQILVAILNKVFSVNTALDFSAINGIISSVSEDIRTSMQTWEMKRFFEIARQVNREEIKSVVLSTGTHGVLVGDTSVLGGEPASVLKTRTGDYSEIKAIAKNIFSETVNNTPKPVTPAQTTPTPNASPSPAEAKPTLEVRNGTAINGLAKKVADQLTKEGYKVIATGNAKSKTIEKTNVYAPKVTQADDAQKIATQLVATAQTDFPEDEAKTTADILIILGADAAK
ncbi:MAG TPA: LCP family protein [Candidatus Andersenbacteria bacterium]|nr:LCP family protein [Candidatus Andersenbacteria bacterium]